MAHDEDMYAGYDMPAFESEEWWLATPVGLMVWARLRVLESGVAQVFDSHGETLVYESDDFARNALRMGFADGRDLSEPASIWHAALLSGLDPVHVNERITAPEIKQRLIDNTAAAHARGVTGVPTLDDGGRLLWGDDQIA